MCAHRKLVNVTPELLELLIFERIGLKTLALEASANSDVLMQMCDRVVSQPPLGGSEEELRAVGSSRCTLTALDVDRCTLSYQAVARFLEVVGRKIISGGGTRTSNNAGRVGRRCFTLHVSFRHLYDDAEAQGPRSFLELKQSFRTLLGRLEEEGLESSNGEHRLRVPGL